MVFVDAEDSDVDNIDAELNSLRRVESNRMRGKARIKKKNTMMAKQEKRCQSFDCLNFANFDFRVCQSVAPLSVNVSSLPSAYGLCH
jgi:hypothetical protein